MLSGSITLKSYNDGDLMRMFGDVLGFAAHQPPALHES